MLHSELLARFERDLAREPDRVLAASRSDVCRVADLDALAREIETTLAASWLERGMALGVRAPAGPGFLATLIAGWRRELAIYPLDSDAPYIERMRVSEQAGLAGVLDVGAAWPGDEPAIDLARVQADRPYEAIHTRAAVLKSTADAQGRARGAAVGTTAILADAAQLTTILPGDDERVLALLPPAGRTGFTVSTLAALIGGRMLVFPEGLTGDRLWAVVRQLGVTTIPLSGVQAARILGAPPPRSGFEQVRFVVAERQPSAELAARFRERVGRPLHALCVRTETGAISFDREGDAAERGTLGRPLDGVDLEFVDGDRLIVGSAAVASRYLPAPDPRLDNGRFDTHEHGRLRDGELEITRRDDPWIQLATHRVHPLEVAAVLKSLREIEDCYVLGVPAEGESGEMVRAVVAGTGNDLRAEDVLSWCRRRLSPRKVPRSVVMVREVPRRADGSVDREALVRLGAEPPAAETTGGD